MITKEDIVAGFDNHPLLGNRSKFSFVERNGVLWFFDLMGGAPGPLWTDGSTVKSVIQIYSDETIPEMESRPENLEVYASVEEAVDRFHDIWINGAE